MKLEAYAAAIICLISFSSIVSADISSLDEPLVFANDQRIDGIGFNNAYNDVNGFNISFFSRGHGSGSYSHESLLHLNNSLKFNETMEDVQEISSYIINFKESTDFSSSPVEFEYGKSFKMGGIQSVGAEETGIKNYASGVSMNARFDNLDTLSKSISANLMWKESAGGDDYNYTELRNATTNLQVNAAFSGRGHIGVRQLNSSMQDVNLLVDEDYSGTYSIAQNLTHVSRLDLKAYADHWLPCCSMGFAQMNPLEQKPFKSAQGIFDCTCFLPPKTS